MKEYVLEPLCPDKFSGTRPKYIEIAISDNDFKLYEKTSEYISSPGGLIILFSTWKNNGDKVLISISNFPLDVESVIVTSFISRLVLPILFYNFNLIFSPDVDIWTI